jgi:hypothetical protein
MAPAAVVCSVAVPVLDSVSWGMYSRSMAGSLGGELNGRGKLETDEGGDARGCCGGRGARRNVVKSLPPPWGTQVYTFNMVSESF